MATDKRDPSSGEFPDGMAPKPPPAKPVEHRSINAILRDLAHVQASLAPQRQDPSGALWLELRDAIDAKK